MNEKIFKVYELYEEAMYRDLLLSKFFDLESEENLDTKIAVLEKLKNGVPPSEIPEYYSILELYPDNDNVLWD